MPANRGEGEGIRGDEKRREAALIFDWLEDRMPARDSLRRIRRLGDIILPILMPCSSTYTPMGAGLPSPEVFAAFFAAIGR